MGINRLSSTNGFTMLEIIIVISIITLFSGFSIARYNDFTLNRELEEESKKMISILELTKKKASSSDIAGYSCGSFNGYQFVLSAPTYDFRLCCASSCTSSYTIETFTFPSYISTTVSGSSSIRFAPITSKTNLSGSTTITLEHTGINKCIPVTISPAGVITEGSKIAC